MNLEDESYDANLLKRMNDKDNPLNPINRQCDLLKRFLRAHDRFNRDDLKDYLNLFCFIQNPPHNKLEKVQILLDSAIHLTKSLKYRDFYDKKPWCLAISNDLSDTLCKWRFIKFIICSYDYDAPIGGWVICF